MIPSSFFFFSFPLYIPRSQTGFERSPGIFAQRGPISSLTKPTTFSGPLKNPQISPPKIPIKIISRNRESTRWHHEDPVTSRDLEPRVSDTRQSWGTRGISPCPKVREKKIGGPPRSRDAHIADWLKTSSDLPKRCRWKKLCFGRGIYLFAAPPGGLISLEMQFHLYPSGLWTESARRELKKKKEKKKWLMQGIKRRTGQQQLGTSWTGLMIISFSFHSWKEIRKEEYQKIN